jgi:hypothetical protein
MTKRFLTIQTIKDSLRKGHLLKDLFKSDAIIFVDKLSTEVYNLYRGGMTEKQIVEKIKDWNI